MKIMLIHGIRASDVTLATLNARNVTCTRLVNLEGSEIYEETTIFVTLNSPVLSFLIFCRIFLQVYIHLFKLAFNIPVSTFGYRDNAF